MFMTRAARLHQFEYSNQQKKSEERRSRMSSVITWMKTLKSTVKVIEPSNITHISKIVKYTRLARSLSPIR